MFDQHNVVSSGFFFLLTSFISGTSAVIFFFENRRLEDIFLGAPSEDPARQTEFLTFALKKLGLEVLQAAFLKKRMHGDSGYDWKTTPSSKGITDICFFLFSCFNC